MVRSQPLPKETTMFATKTRTAVNTLLARLLTFVAIATAGMTLIGAAPASAQPNGPPTSSKGCPVEDEHGNVFYVPAGTHYLLFTCGTDGEWHGGWAITGIRKPPPSSGGPGVLAHGVLQLDAHHARSLRKLQLKNYQPQARTVRLGSS
jgi:hypothetical protein